MFVCLIGILGFSKPAKSQVVARCIRVSTTIPGETRVTYRCVSSAGAVVHRYHLLDSFSGGVRSPQPATPLECAQARLTRGPNCDSNPGTPANTPTQTSLDLVVDRGFLPPTADARRVVSLFYGCIGSGSNGVRGCAREVYNSAISEFGTNWWGGIQCDECTGILAELGDFVENGGFFDPQIDYIDVSIGFPAGISVEPHIDLIPEWMKWAYNLSREQMACAFYHATMNSMGCAP